MLNALMPGTEVPIHRHTQSNEIVILLCGKIIEVLYDDTGNGVAVGGDGCHLSTLCFAHAECATGRSHGCDEGNGTMMCDSNNNHSVLL